MAAQGVPEPSPAKQPSDYRNGDLVSRLLAATPPYLYNMPLLPNSFFFSEMLRSFVQAKAATSASSTGHGHQPSTPGRRGRKRTWKDTTKVHHHSMMNMHSENLREQSINDKPLELTTSSRTTPPPPTKPPTPPPTTILLPPPQQHNPPEQFTPNTQVPPPPPPPLWYPPSMYHQPPYAATAPFDPLHFFIDLRVSGHIWDQTKNTQEQDSGNNRSVEPLDLQTDQKMGLNLKAPSSSSSTMIPSQPEQLSLFKPSRKHISAFAVPRPRDVLHAYADATKCGPDVEGGNDQHKTTNIFGTNYVLQNLSKIYKEVESKSKREDGNKPIKVDVEEVKADVDVRCDVKTDEDQKEAEKEKKCRDLRALIGLELVKDYVSIEGKRYPKGCVPLNRSNDKNGCTSSTTDTGSTLKKEATEYINGDDIMDNDDDNSSNIQVDDDDDDDIVDDDDSDNYENDLSRRLVNNTKNMQYIDYSQNRSKE